MLKRKYRLGIRVFPANKRKTSFSKTLATEFFSLRISQNNLSYNRYGFVVSKKIDKRAVIRNRVKRVLRSCIEEIVHEVKIGYDLLFFLKKQAVDAKRDVLCQSVAVFLREQKMIV